MKKIVGVLLISCFVLWIIFAKNIISILFYIQWDVAFKKQNYWVAETKYLQSIDYLRHYNVEFNYANTLYYLWKNENNLEKKVKLYQNALDIYTKLLDEEKKAEVETNYKIVKEELDKLFAEQQKQKDDETSEQDSSSDWDNSEKNNWEENENNISEQKWNTDWDEKDDSSWDKDNESDKNTNLNNKENQQNSSNDSWSKNNQEKYELSEQDIKNIEEYTRDLQKEQTQNQQYFNKKWNTWLSVEDQMKNKFFNDTFFNEVFDRGWEKDW